MSDQKQEGISDPETRKNILRRLLQVAVSIIITAIILFVAAGRLEWIYAWVYIIASVAVIIINSFILKRELISERGRKKENIESWDRTIQGLIIIFWIVLFLVSGLDIRYEWSPGSALWVHIAGLIVFFAGNAIVSWSMISNNYFSTAVRIQYDRDHAVSNGGPYGYMRHPGYLGISLYNLSTPLILGSFWALLPAGILVILFIIRTILEDSTLKLKLEGYKEYADKVKFRLIPFVW
jgi:protein-S-isoprenylcysteine O-methyltransferase Ste14